MPTAINKTASDVRRRNVNGLCDFAVSGTVIEHGLGGVEVEANSSARLPPVHVLLASRGPAAVTGKISLFIVDTVKRQTFRALAHVSDEISKISPVFADCDASAAVIIKAVVARIMAPVDHVKPCVVGAASFPVSRVSVFGAIVEFGHGNLLSRLAASSGGQTRQGLAAAITVS